MRELARLNITRKPYQGFTNLFEILKPENYEYFLSTTQVISDMMNPKKPS